MNFMNAVLAELNMASRTLEGLEEKERKDSILVPIGGGSYIQARVENTEQIIYGIGAGVSIEKTMGEAKNEIMNRISETNKTRIALEQQLTQVLQRLNEDQSRFQELTAPTKGQI